MPISLTTRYTVSDARAQKMKDSFNALLGASVVNDVVLTDTYTIDAELSAENQEIARAAFENALLEKTTCNDSQAPDTFDWVIDVGFLPGVTDNVGTTVRETVQDACKLTFADHEHAYSSQTVYLSGDLSEEQANTVAHSLHNSLIQRVTIKNKADFDRDGGLETTVPRVTLAGATDVSEINLSVSDEELSELGAKGIANADGSRRGPLALELDYLKVIQDYFAKEGRKPTDIELESIAQTWSEHCKHTIFSDAIDDLTDGIYRTYIKGATKKIRENLGDKDFCVSVFTDNSGAIAFDEDYLVTHKAETHNSPSALDPFGGAITGIVGVNRDALGTGLGAKPIVNLYGFCLGDPNDATMLYRDQKQKQPVLSARRILDGVVHGINAGGNQSGIPTAQGFLLFDDRYRGKPLVFAGTVGLLPRKNDDRLLHEKKANPGDLVVMIGGRVGKDGIHGATFSSVALDEGSPATAVQIGDPITQKKFSDAIVREARDQNLYSSITDNGAGGLSCSVAEMAQEAGGFEVDLDVIPTKYAGLAPWETWISESQERMTFSVPQDKWEAFFALMTKHGVEATAVGTFTDTGRGVVKSDGETIFDLELEFLHNGLPKRELKTAKPEATHSDPEPSAQKDYSAAILVMLSRLNLASTEFVARQYDHEVQSGSVLKPLQGKGEVIAHAAAMRPRLESEKGIVLSFGITPHYTEIDPYAMATAAIDMALRNAIGAGAKLSHMAILDNFCWCSSNDPERLWQLKEAARGCFDAAVAFGTPFISGKDSMFNDFKGFDKDGAETKISIPPTLLISSIGVVDDATKTVSLDFKRPGDMIYVLGQTHDECGGSEYYRYRADEEQTEHYGSSAPQTDLVKNKELYQKLEEAIEQNLVASSVGVNAGGLSMAIAKSALGGKRGCDVSLKDLPGSAANNEQALFSESAGRLVVSVAPEKKEKFEEVMNGKIFGALGTVTDDDTMTIAGMSGEQIAQCSLSDVEEHYKKTFKGF